MCFAEPGRVSSIEGSMITVLTSEGPTEASLRLVEAEGQPVVVGDWVLVSLGLVVSVVDEAAGRALFNEMTAIRQDLDR
jgi:hydrogenase assembly chaperone HypC/HupF